MSDRYTQLVNTPLGRMVSRQVGLPAPTRLERYKLGQPLISGPVLLGGAEGGHLVGPLAGLLAAAGTEVRTALEPEVRAAAAAAGLKAGIFNPDAATEDDTFKGLVFDASGIDSSRRLREAWAFLHPTIRRLERCGRLVVLGTAPEVCGEPSQAVAQRALEGFTRSVGKELRRGATAQLLYVEPGAEGLIESTVRFFLSPRSAYVSGQVVRVKTAHPGASADTGDWERPLNGKVALVTGASRGIGAAIAEVLARDGAHVVGLDVSAQREPLEAVVQRIRGSALTIDITEADAPARISERLLEEHGGVDVVVHNAGVTRDKTLGRMDEELWDLVLSINLIAPEAINRELVHRGALRPGGRSVCVSSISGIAGTAGQTNYATSKAGVIGIVQASAGQLSEQGVTINAVAPGFIETQMTAAMPPIPREAGRRMNSLAQGGLPVDVAETVAWFASPGSAGVTGQVVRVCGQSLIGA